MSVNQRHVSATLTVQDVVDLAAEHDVKLTLAQARKLLTEHRKKIGFAMGIAANEVVTQLVLAEGRPKHGYTVYLNGSITTGASLQVQAADAKDAVRIAEEMMEDEKVSSAVAWRDDNGLLTGAPDDIYYECDEQDRDVVVPVDKDA